VHVVFLGIIELFDYTQLNNLFLHVQWNCPYQIIKGHFRPDDDWSIQSKRRQSYFPNSSW